MVRAASSPFLDMQRWVATQMISPWMTISPRRVGGAADLLSDMIPTVKDDASYEGKFYPCPTALRTLPLLARRLL